MSTINPIEKKEMSFGYQSRQTNTRPVPANGNSVSINFADHLARTMTNNENPAETPAINRSFHGIPMGLSGSQGMDIAPSTANIAYIRAGGKSHALAQYERPSLPVYDMNG